MKFSLEDRHWKILCNLAIEPLKSRGVRIWIYGSRVTNKHHAYSDIDLLYAPSAVLPPTYIGSIEEALEESALSFKVDLVNDANLADSYRPQINAQKIEV